MKIGVDISQLTYEGTGVARYLSSLLNVMIKNDTENEYILFYSSLRRNLSESIIDKFKSPRVQIKKFRFPPMFLNLLWNKLHLFPIESFLGNLDIFISSDWTQPPTRKAQKITILYDLIVYKFPKETADAIIKTQKSRLNWVIKECDEVLCISEATKNDAAKILGIHESKLHVIYPGI